MDNQLLNTISSVIGLIIAITIHEFAHAYAADKLGDPTPRANGRLTLNPLAHLDPLGTLMLFIVNFGWGKPVPIDPYNLTKKSENIVSLAGIFTNLVFAIILSIVIHVIQPNLVIYQMMASILYINVALAVFNLLPIPPLDGSKVFLNLLPEQLSLEWSEVFDRYGFVLLALLLFLPVNGSSIINLVISPIINFIYSILMS
ncbi:site-2 protease family protein [Candidatus Shapirobacteria bacterium]|nr:site-2 protease family protein [Candidatus Shapirobacteria bacterium]